MRPLYPATTSSLEPEKGPELFGPLPQAVDRAELGLLGPPNHLMTVVDDEVGTGLEDVGPVEGHQMVGAA